MIYLFFGYSFFQYSGFCFLSNTFLSSFVNGFCPGGLTPFFYKNIIINILTVK